MVGDGARRQNQRRERRSAGERDEDRRQEGAMSVPSTSTLLERLKGRLVDPFEACC